MSVDTARRVRFWYGIFLSVFTVVMGILFLAQISDIYFNSDLEQKYTREIVWQHLFPVLIPFCFWVAAIIAGFVLSVVFPCASNKKKKRTAYETLQKLRGKIPQGEGEEFNQNLAKYKKAELWLTIVWGVYAEICIALVVLAFVYAFNILNNQVLVSFVVLNVLVLVGCFGIVFLDGFLSKIRDACIKNMMQFNDKDYTQNIIKYVKTEYRRKAVWCFCAEVLVISIIATFVYIFNPANFPAKSLNGEVLAMARFVLPFVAVSILCCCGAVVFEGVLSKTQLNYVKNMIKIGGKANPSKENAFVAVINKNEKWVVLGLRIALLVVAVAFIIAGSINGGAHDVFIKAINICTECIGLG